MATRSRIGTLNKDGSIRYVYCHWDGYPSWNGKVLLDKYSTQEKVDELLDMGDISQLEESIANSVFYHRNRWMSWENVQPTIVETMDEFLDLCDEEYVYFFKDGTWYVADHMNKEFHVLDLSNVEDKDDVSKMPPAENIMEMA